MATTPSQLLPSNFFARPAQADAPELIGCPLVNCQSSGDVLWAAVVGTEAYSQGEPACYGYRRLKPSNETLFGKPGRFLGYEDL